jgi:HipA-like protein
MADELAVFLAGKHVGTVSGPRGGRYEFTYTDDYRRTGRVPLSPTLAIGPGPLMDTSDDAFDLLTGMGLDGHCRARRTNSR